MNPERQRMVNLAYRASHYRLDKLYCGIWPLMREKSPALWTDLMAAIADMEKKAIVFMNEESERAQFDTSLAAHEANVCALVRRHTGDPEPVVNTPLSHSGSPPSQVMETSSHTDPATSSSPAGNEDIRW